MDDSIAGRLNLLKDTTDKNIRHKLIGELSLELMALSRDDHISYSDVWSVARELKKHIGPSLQDDKMASEMISELTHWDEYSAGNVGKDGKSAEERMAGDMMAGVWYEELACVIVYYQLVVHGGVVGSCSFIVWDDNGLHSREQSNKVGKVLNKILASSNGLEDFISKLPKNIGDYHLCATPSVKREFKHDIYNQ